MHVKIHHRLWKLNRTWSALTGEPRRRFSCPAKRHLVVGELGCQPKDNSFARPHGTCHIWMAQPGWMEPKLKMSARRLVGMRNIGDVSARSRGKGLAAQHQNTNIEALLRPMTESECRCDDCHHRDRARAEPCCALLRLVGSEDVNPPSMRESGVELAGKWGGQDATLSLARSKLTNPHAPVSIRFDPGCVSYSSLVRC